MPLKVLHIIWHLGQGGAQTYLYNLLKLQVLDDELEPRLLVLGERGELSDSFEALLDVSYLNMRSGLDAPKIIRIPTALRKSGARLIHSHSNNLALNLAFQLVQIPIVCTEHGGGLLGGRRKDRIVYRYLSKAMARYIAISREMASVMAEANASLKTRIDVVYNGVDIDAISATPVCDTRSLDARIGRASYRVGIVGRLEFQKGVDLFIESASYLCEMRSDTVFLVIGDGSLRPRLERLAFEKGITDSVIFLGYRSDALSLVKLLDIFLFTSNFEPFGLVIVESMVAGVPVVATDSPGAVREIITSGENGVVVKDRNPRMLAEVVNSLLNDECSRSGIARMAKHAVAERFTIQANADGVKAVYRKALPGPTASAA